MAEIAKTTTSSRKLIDISIISDRLEISAIKDSAATGGLYTLTDYTREILTAYMDAKDKNPEITPQNLISFIIKK